MSKTVKHLASGVTIRAADGSLVHCAPLMLGDAMAIIDEWGKLQSPKPIEQMDAQIAIARILATRYPQLRDKISVGDVLKVLAPFFLQETSARVVTSPGASQTGTTSGSPTSPPGASVPT